MSALTFIINVCVVIAYVVSSVHYIHRAIPELKKGARVFVKFSGPAGADKLAQKSKGVSLQVLKKAALKQHEDFAATLQSSAVSGSVVHKYSTLFNGVSLQLEDQRDFEILKGMPGVVDVFPVRSFSMMSLKIAPVRDLVSEPPTSDVFKPTAHQLTGVDIIRKEHPLITGKGVKVGIIDSGIDYLHPAFSIPGQICTSFKGPGCRVRFGTDFVGDGDDSNGYINPLPDGDPMDTCNGHGTHVAGIVGGKDERIQGVAPDVIFGAYRVLDCKGRTSDDLIVAGLEAAFQDGMQIINLSVDGGRFENSYPTAQAVDQLSQNGVIIIASAGNYGRMGYSTVASPSTASKALSVASYDNSQSFETFLKVTGASGLTEVAFMYSPSDGITARFKENTQFTVVASPQQTSVNGDGCSKFNPGTFKGGLALMKQSGLCTFSVMVANAIECGAIGAIIYSSFPGGMAGILNATTANFPAAFISGIDGNAMVNSAKYNELVTVSFKNTRAVRPHSNAGLPSELSSMGLDLSLLMKPDVGAPGGNIISSYPRALGSYNEQSGSSMSSPYMAGVAALDVQISGGKTEFMSFQRRIHITSRPSMTRGDVGTGGTALSVAKTGAGLVNVPKFLFSQMDIEPSKLELGDGNSVKHRTIKVTNNGNLQQSYKISHIPSESFKAVPNVPQHLLHRDNSSAKLAFSATTLSVPPGKTVEFDVIFAADFAASHWVRSGFISLTSSSDPMGGLSIPYVFMTGDYSKMPILGEQFPPRLYPASIEDNRDVAAFDGNSIPIFDFKTKATSPTVVFEMIFPTRRMNVILVSATTMPPIGMIESHEYAEPFGETSFDLRSTVFDLNDPTKELDVPNGDFKIIIQIVPSRALTPIPDVSTALVTVFVSRSFTVNIEGGPVGSSTITRTPPSYYSYLFSSLYLLVFLGFFFLWLILRGPIDKQNRFDQII